MVCCRFPLPPIRQTIIILEPLTEISEEDRGQLTEKNWQNIHIFLDTLKDGSNLCFQDMLKELQMTENQYLLVFTVQIKFFSFI
jgi:hypothetical protein